VALIKYELPAEPAVGSRTYMCPLCEVENLRIQYGAKGDKNDALHQDGEKRWWFMCTSRGNHSVLDALAKHVGVSVGAFIAETNTWETYADWFGEPVASKRGSGSSSAGGRAKMPPVERVNEWVDRLWSKHGKAARKYLRSRGISDDVAKANMIGWSAGMRLMFPMWDADGELVHWKRRKLGAGHQMHNPNDRRSPTLYPVPESDAGWVLLVAGELDGLCALSAGLPATSVTQGASVWLPGWTEALCGLRVVVCFDNNERDLARDRVRELRAAGIDATRCDLGKLGLRESDGDVSDYLNGGSDPRALRP
jgi:hypothetical protein